MQKTQQINQGSNSSGERRTDVVIIGAGSAGLHALREVRRAGREFLIIDHGPLGTTCARVGCMPSKVALHAGAGWAMRKMLPDIGVHGVDQLSVDLSMAWAQLRKQRDFFVGKATGMTHAAAGDNLIAGHARFKELNLIEVQTDDGVQHIRAKAVVIATGSRPVMPEWLDAVRDRTITTDDLFELEAMPQSVGILGLGAIGLEMGVALSRLGVRVVGADLAAQVAGIDDPQVAECAREYFGQEMELWLDTQTSIEKTETGLRMSAGGRTADVDLLLAALGRRPNIDDLGLQDVGVKFDDRGRPVFNSSTLQIGDLPIFIAGDANADRPLMHEAADQGAIAGYNAARDMVTRFERKVSLGIAFSDPDVAVVGARFSSLNDEDIIIGSASGDANGRSRILGETDNLLRIYADAGDGRLLGASIFAESGEHLAHLLAWAIQRGETATDLLHLPYYHPVIEEMIQAALQDIVRQLPVTSPYPLGLSPVAKS